MSYFTRMATFIFLPAQFFHREIYCLGNLQTGGHAQLQAVAGGRGNCAGRGQ